MSANRKLRRKQKRDQRTSLQPAAALSQYPEIVQSLSMVQRLRQDGQFDKASELCSQLVAIEPHNKNLHFALATAFEDAGRIDDAISAFRRCITLAPEFAAAYAQLARCLLAVKDLPECIACCKKALQLAPDMVSVHQFAGKVYERLARFKDAAVHFKIVAERTGLHTDYEQLGSALNLANDVDGARSAFQTAIKNGSPRARILIMLGRIEASRGDFTQALTHLKTALRVDPYDGYAHFQLAGDLGDIIDVKTQISLAEAALSSGKLPANRFDAFIPINFALGHLRERNKQYDRAFEHFRIANDAIVSEQTDDNDATAAKFDHVRQRFNADSVAIRTKHGAQSEQPVFVFGLPRSGTTLVEQILSSHSRAAGLGELEGLAWMTDYLCDDDPETFHTAAANYLACRPAQTADIDRVVDKSISTYLHAGMALTLFPNAHLINCRRHPMDIANSLYRIYFGPRTVPFANSFTRMAARFRLYEQIMTHWHQQFPGRILDVRYEDVVENPETTARLLVSHIGLDWEPACLDFHESRNIVHTASLTQVRKPIYSSSVGKWRRYERQYESLERDISLLIKGYEAGNQPQ